MVEPLIPVDDAGSCDGPMMIAVARRDATELRMEMERHAHARGQLFGTRRGLFTVETAEGRWIVPETHAVWVPPHHPHGGRSHGPFDGWSLYVVPTACAGLPERPVTIRTTGLLREAVARASTWDDGPFDAARLHLAHVILDEIRSLPPERFGLPMPRDPRLARLARALVDDPASPRGLDAWAAFAGVAPRTLSRRFPVETGFSFTEWRQRARLTRALEMLADGAPVTAVALDLGYSNISAFIALFRRSFGVTPGAYRRGDGPGKRGA